jgi:hypothetical protein
MWLCEAGVKLWAQQSLLARRVPKSPERYWRCAAVTLVRRGESSYVSPHIRKSQQNQRVRGNVKLLISFTFSRMRGFLRGKLVPHVVDFGMDL